VPKLKRGRIPVLKNRVSVSQKRQITIPVEFYNSLGIEKEVECYVQNAD
jgi:bifunctional DNA-binding transcriptional regulator/antitoxin component of YhaV-PrlF toxin-antitoxin module